MTDITKTNSIDLHIWIAEHGDQEARKLICKEVDIDPATLCRILKGHNPKFETRWRIFKTTGIVIDSADDDKFKAAVARRDAS